MFTIRPATSADVEPAVATIVAAFTGDPLISYFFREDPSASARFFSILLRARLALAMPAFALQQANDVLGLAMGYDASRPKWPAALTAEWDQLEADLLALPARFAAYDAVSEAHQPSEPHYYLGVIAVHPSLHRQGAGTALMDAFCAASRADPDSAGVYLETSSDESLKFYLRYGFELRGEGRLETVPLWCLFNPT